MPQSWRQQISICDGVAAMAIAGFALAARVGFLGEGVERIERRIKLEKLERETAIQIVFPSRNRIAMEKNMPQEP